MQRLRVGVVGVGHLGRHHARVFAGIDGVELVGVADARLAQAEAVAGPLGAAAFEDYRELIGRVDAVSVAAPTSLHREIAGAFLERGISAMVEKPLTSRVDHARELVELARSNNATLQVGHIERFNPALSALDDVRIRPRYISAERAGTFTFRSTDIGVVFDLMIHDIDLILAMVSAPVRGVSAIGVSLFGPLEDVAQARVEFADGTVADLTASRASMQATRKMRIWGSEGYVALDFAAKTGTRVRPSDLLRQGMLDVEGLDLSQPAAVKERLFGKILRVDQVKAEGREPLVLELEDFVHSVRIGATPRVSGEDALRSVTLAAQIVDSLQTHAWDGHAEGPTGPRDLPMPAVEPIAGLLGPISWRSKVGRAVPVDGRD